MAAALGSASTANSVGGCHRWSQSATTETTTRMEMLRTTESAIWDRSLAAGQLLTSACRGTNTVKARARITRSGPFTSVSHRRDRAKTVARAEPSRTRASARSDGLAAEVNACRCSPEASAGPDQEAADGREQAEDDGPGLGKLLRGSLTQSRTRDGDLCRTRACGGITSLDRQRGRCTRVPGHYRLGQPLGPAPPGEIAQRQPARRNKMAHGEVRFVDDAEIRGSPAKVDEDLRLVTAEEATSRPPDEIPGREGTIGHPSDRLLRPRRFRTSVRFVR